MNTAALIVCGFYTPDYEHHFYKRGLRDDIETLGYDHYFQSVEKLPGGWSVNTRQKPTAILRAMDRHPGKQILWIDVDCRIARPIDGAVLFNTDVAMHFKSSLRRAGFWYRGAYRAKLHPWSGTMIFAPTSNARRFLEKWEAANGELVTRDVDETALGLAIARTPGLRVTNLSHAWCASPRYPHPDPIIVHGRGRPQGEIDQEIPFLRRAKRAIISSVVGKPYHEWKKGRSHE